MVGGSYRIAGVRKAFENRALAAVLSARGPALVSHLGAAYLHGFEKINVPGFVDITVPRHRRPRRRPGVTVHESKAFDLAGAVVRNRIPVTGVARTILDCSSVVDEPIRLLDDAIRRRIVTWGELWSCHLSHNVTGRHGIAVYRRILLERDGNTPPGGNFARLMAEMLTEAGLPAPVFEHPVSVPGHDYYLDLPCSTTGIPPQHGSLDRNAGGRRNASGAPPGGDAPPSLPRWSRWA